MAKWLSLSSSAKKLCLYEKEIETLLYQNEEIQKCGGFDGPFGEGET